MLLSFLAIVFVFGVIVLVHEWGHMTAAKLCGVSVPDFAIGMGPSLWHLDYHGTRYHFCAFPIGGFVRIAGLEGDDALASTRKDLEASGSIQPLEPMSDAEVTAESLRRLNEVSISAVPGGMYSGWKTWKNLNGFQKAFILFGGPLMNFLLALVIIFAMGALGFPQNAVLIAEVTPGSPAEVAGLKPGDLVTEIGGERVTNSRQFAAIVHAYRARPLDLTVQRNGDTLHLTATPDVIAGYNGGKVSIGISMSDQGYLTNEVGLIQPKSLADKRLKTTDGQEIRLGVGDRITAIDGQPLNNGLDLITKLAEVDENGLVLKPADKDFTLSVLTRAGQQHEIVVPKDTTIISLGIQFKPELQKLPWRESFARSLEDSKIYMVSMIWGLKMLLTPEGAKSISGPVGIVRMIGQSAQAGLHTFLFVFMLINLNLGLMNLLPIPALDGGRLVFVALNGIGVRINEKREALVHAMGMVLLLTLIGLVTLTDVLAWL